MVCRIVEVLPPEKLSATSCEGGSLLGCNWWGRSESLESDSRPKNPAPRGPTNVVADIVSKATALPELQRVAGNAAVIEGGAK